MTENIQIEVAAVSLTNTGLKSSEDGKWYNYGGKDKEAVNEVIAQIHRGDTVGLALVDGKFTELVVLSRASSSNKSAPVANSSRQLGDDYETYQDLLVRLKEETAGRYSIETKALEIDSKEKRAIFQAHVKGEFGVVTRQKLVADKIVGIQEPNARWATGHGDCDQENGGVVRSHYIRMAETRAVARALRAILGIDQGGD
jgi:hypothetical protein